MHLNDRCVQLYWCDHRHQRRILNERIQRKTSKTMNNYKGILDVPDDMHVQDVRTQMASKHFILSKIMSTQWFLNRTPIWLQRVWSRKTYGRKC